MITQNEGFENTPNEIKTAMKELKINKALRDAGITKKQGKETKTIFWFLLLLVFQQKNLWQYLQSRYQETAFSKNTYYRFLNSSTYNWRRFLHRVAAVAISYFGSLTRPSRVKAFVLDDSVIDKNRSKKVELSANIYDHVAHKFVRGFTLLGLGWTDGYNYVPVDFAMLSSTKQANRYCEASDAIDKRTNGYKRRTEAMMHKPEVACNLVAQALKAGIHADYVLMDTWFTTEPMLQSLRSLGMDVIGMVKQLKQFYVYQGKHFHLNQLHALLPKCNRNKNIQGSLIVTTKAGISVKLVFVQNRNRRKRWLTILSTDVSLVDEEIVRIYGNRWSIEVFFKASKSLLKLDCEFQGRCYDLYIAHTTIVSVRYILLEWVRRFTNDPKTIGELFLALCDDIQDLPFAQALQSLLFLLQDTVQNVSNAVACSICCQLTNWLSAQPLFIQALLPVLGWES